MAPDSRRLDSFFFFFFSSLQPESALQNKPDAGVKCTRHPAYDSILPLRCAQAFSVMCADEGLRLRARPGGAAAQRGALGAGGCGSRSSPGTPLMSSTTASNMSPRSSTTSHTHTHTLAEQRTHTHTHTRHSCSTELQHYTLREWQYACSNIQTQSETNKDAHTRMYRDAKIVHTHFLTHTHTHTSQLLHSPLYSTKERESIY